MKVAAVLALVLVAFFLGVLWARKPVSCAIVPSSVGQVMVCSNDFKEQVKL